MNFADFLSFLALVTLLYGAYKYSKGDDVDDNDHLKPGYH